MAGNQHRSRYGHKTGTDTHKHAQPTLTWVSNDEVNFRKQQMREEKVEDVIFWWGHVLFMLSAETLVKSQECK